MQRKSSIFTSALRLRINHCFFYIYGIKNTVYTTQPVCCVKTSRARSQHLPKDRGRPDVNIQPAHLCFALFPVNTQTNKQINKRRCNDGGALKGGSSLLCNADRSNFSCIRGLLPLLGQVPGHLLRGGLMLNSWSFLKLLPDKQTSSTTTTKLQSTF